LVGVLVAKLQPRHRIGQAVLVAYLRNQIEIVIGRILHVEAARVAGISMEHGAVAILVEDAGAGHLVDLRRQGVEIVALLAVLDLAV
jgi:hypothetical protein